MSRQMTAPAAGQLGSAQPLVTLADRFSQLAMSFADGADGADGR